MKSPDRDAADELVERFKDRIFAARDHGEIYVSIRSHVAIDLLALLFSRASELATLRRRVAELERATTGLLSEWDKLARYGSPMAKAANERVLFARALLSPPTRKE